MIDTHPAASLRQASPRRSLPQSLQHWWDSLDGVQRSLLILALVRLLIALLFLLNVFPLELRYRWYLYHGGDQDQMMSLAQSIIDGLPERSVVGIGESLIMLPWIALLRPANILEFITPLVVIHGFLLGGISVLLVGGAARRLTGSPKIAIWAAAVWACLPLITYFSFFWHPDPVILRSAAVPRVGWLNSLSDGPATFFLLLALFCLARVSDKRGEASFEWMAGAGAAMSLAVVFRVHVATMVAFMLLYILIAHGWRALFAACGAGLLTYAPQAWYNLTVFGLPVTTGYISYGDIGAWGGTTRRPLVNILTNLPFDPRHFMGMIEYFAERRPWLLALLALVLAAGAYASIMLWRQRGWRVCALLIAAPLAYLLPMLTAFNFRQDPIRFGMPTVPMFLIAGTYAVGWTGSWLRDRLQSRWASVYRD